MLTGFDCKADSLSHKMRAGGLLDLFLDTVAPLSNGHTTVADMLWAGLPVLTLPGPAKPARVAAAIAIAAGCTNGVARTMSEYVALAVALVKASNINASSERWRCTAGWQVMDGKVFAGR